MDTHVCLDCRKKDLFISKTKAKKEYFMDDGDFQELFSMEMHSNVYKSQIITLYVKDEIIKMENEKFGGNIEKHKEKVEQDKKDRKIKRFATIRKNDINSSVEDKFESSNKYVTLNTNNEERNITAKNYIQKYILRL